MKILVIRLSSIGDVVLTTPVLRCMKRQLQDCEVHIITKRICGELLEGNPNVDRLIEYDGSGEQEGMLRKEHYDYVVDLHNNHRSRRLRRALRRRTLVYRKENFGKFMLVLTKWDIMSGRHVVDRYFDAVKPLGVENDNLGLELQNFELPKLELPNLKLQYHKSPSPCPVDRQYVVIACGAQHETKRIPPEKIALLARGIKNQVVLVGDRNDRQRMESITLSDNVLNLCGETTLRESAAMIAHSDYVITPDSAMMHVAAAYHRKVIAVWGCTSPRFGFWAYGTERIDCTPQGLHCWPCRRMGVEKCPKGHFDCMMKQDYEKIIKIINDEKDSTI